MVAHTLVPLDPLVTKQDKNLQNLTEKTDTTGPASRDEDSKNYKIGAKGFCRGHIRQPSSHDFAFIMEDSRVKKPDQPATPARILFPDLHAAGESCQHGKRAVATNDAPSLSTDDSSTMAVGPITKPSATPAAPTGFIAVPGNIGRGAGTRDRGRTLSSRPSMSLLLPYVPASSSPSAQRLSGDRSTRPSKTASKVGRLSFLKLRLLTFGRWWRGADRLKFNKKQSSPVASSAEATKQRVLSDYLRLSKITFC